MTNWRPMKTQYNVNGPLFPKQKSTIKADFINFYQQKTR